MPLINKEDKPAIPTIIFLGLDVGPDIAAEVNAALVKFKTSNEQLVRTIEAYINPPG